MADAANLIVSAIVRRDERLLLVEQQAPSDPEPSWMLPGGRVEDGETLVAALEYDCAPLERFLSGDAHAGAVYVWDRT